MMKTWAFLVAMLSCAGAGAAELEASVVDGDGKPLADAVVVAVSTQPATHGAALPDPEDAIDQIDKEFVPYVKAIRVGTKVRFPNKDNIRHHVYSFSPAKRFQLPLYAGETAPPVLFDQPGVVVMGCNIHDWMIGYVYVSESPYFAKTGDDGKARLVGLPAGVYAVRVWHPDAVGTEASTTRPIRVETDADRLREGWKIEVKPSLRPRRAPTTKGPGYR